MSTQIKEVSTLDVDAEAAGDVMRVNAQQYELPTLTRQEMEFAAAWAVASGDKEFAAKRANIPVYKAALWAKREDIQLHVNTLLGQHREMLGYEVAYTLADAHADIEIGKRMSANASEWFKGVEMQIRLHGLDKRPDTVVNVNINSREQLEQVDSDELMRIAGFSYDALLPQAIDAEVVDDDE